MNYKPYFSVGSDGKPLPRKQRKADRKQVFAHNDGLHSRRSKQERKQKAG